MTELKNILNYSIKNNAERVRNEISFIVCTKLLYYTCKLLNKLDYVASFLNTNKNVC